MSFSMGTTSDYLALTPFTPIVPVTISAWCRATSAADRTIWHQRIGDSSMNSSIRLMLYGGKVRADHTSGGTNSAAYSTGSFPTDGTWFHCCGYLPATTSRIAYLNGVAGTTNTATRSSFTPDRHRLFSLAPLSASGMLDQVAEIGVWTAALTAAEILALSRGFPPTKIRPQSLRNYVRGLRTLRTLVGEPGTISGTSSPEDFHPRMYYQA